MSRWVSSKRPKPCGASPAFSPGYLPSQEAGLLPVPGATVDTEYAELPQVMAPGSNDFLANYRYGLASDGVMEVGLPSVIIPVQDDGAQVWGEQGRAIPGPASVLSQQ